ncbi:DEAD/DEAH box helicase family protein [Lactiplantibacillus plantarum]
MDDFLDFDKILSDSNSSKLDDPRDIFDVQDKNEKYDGTLRPGQDIVLKKWYEGYKDKNNTIIKMNTGNGKTVVGLLILQSYLNDDQGPAVYVVPDNFLVEQVLQEAADLDLNVTKNNNSTDFIEGKAILVINMHKMFNGRSVFGVNKKKIDIGCIVIDDAHACVNIAKKQFEIYVPRENKELYEFFLNTFSNSIRQQSKIRFDEITNGEPGAQQLIPYWSWEEKLDIVRKRLMDYKDNDSFEDKSLYFNWDLLKENLKIVDCIISSKGVSLSLEYIPIEVIPSFKSCPHKIFMSATIEDDTTLATQFDIKQEDLTEAITPNKANDIGERMILIPQRLSTKIQDDELKILFKKLAETHNVMILVPSGNRAEYWRDCANYVVESQEQMINIIKEMKQGLVGIVVIKNRYDGIDLPKSTCNVLVIDGLPDTRTGYDKFEESALMNTDSITLEKIQKIEQGMGRATRSREDYSVIFLMGRNLVNILNPANQKKFTVSTQKQLKISRALTNQLEEKNNIIPLNLLYKASLVCLKRKKEWVEIHKKALLGEKYDSSVNVNIQMLKLKECFDLYRNREYADCLKIMQDLINKETDPLKKGYLKFKYAKYENTVNQAQSQEILKSARKLNKGIIYPIDGIQYKRIVNTKTTQVERISKFNARFSNQNDYIIYVQSVISDMAFNNVTAHTFEETMKKAGEIIGFHSEKPEEENGKGPDNLWIGSEDVSFVIECKNEATVAKISKSYCNQLNGSIEWFSTIYKDVLTGIPVIIHPSTTFEYEASPNNNIRVIDTEKLQEFNNAILKFSTEICENIENNLLISKQLKSNKLEFNSIKDTFTKNYRTEKR